MKKLFLLSSNLCAYLMMGTGAGIFLLSLDRLAVMAIAVVIFLIGIALVYYSNKREKYKKSIYGLFLLPVLFCGVMFKILPNVQTSPIAYIWLSLILILAIFSIFSHWKLK